MSHGSKENRKPIEKNDKPLDTLGTRSAACIQSSSSNVIKSKTSSSVPTSRRSPKRLRSIHNDETEERCRGSGHQNVNRKRRCIPSTILSDNTTPHKISTVHRYGAPAIESRSTVSRPINNTRTNDSSIMNSTYLEDGKLNIKLPHSLEYVKRTFPSTARHGYTDHSLGTLHLSQSQMTHLIAKMLPVTHAKDITHSHLVEFYQSCWQLGPGHERAARMAAQIDPKTATRRTLVKWISEISCKMKWTTSTCYAAIATLDAYVTLAQHQVPLSNLPKIAATCLYYASQMQETAVDECIIPIDRFLSICPEVGTSAEFLDHQVHLVDTLQGVNFSRKTPFDILQLFLARLQTNSGLIGERLFRVLLTKCFLPLIFDAMHLANLTAYYCVGLNQWIPTPVWVYCGLYHSIRRLMLRTPRGGDEWLQACGMSEPILLSMTDEERIKLVENLIVVALLDATHLGCIDVPCSDSCPSPLGEGDDESNDRWVDLELPSDAGYHLCKVDPLKRQYLSECCNITDQLFTKCLAVTSNSSLIGSTLNHTELEANLLASSEAIRRKPTTISASAVMELKLNRKYGHLYNNENLPTYFSRHQKISMTTKFATEVPLDCIRHSALWLHVHPDRAFTEIDHRYRREAQIAIHECSQSLLVAEMNQIANNQPYKPPAESMDDVSADKITRNRRGSVCGGLESIPTRMNRLSIQAPLRKLT